MESSDHLPKVCRIPMMISAILSLICFILSFPLLAAEPPRPQMGKNLKDCTTKLTRQGGGWCEIRGSETHPFITSVWPKKLDGKTRMVTGPGSILGAWNGAAYDNKDHKFYFLGGGHTDYGGNEVYEFDLNTGLWSRLTDPSPLNSLYRLWPKRSGKPARYCWVPDLNKVPPSAHTYDGVQFSKNTGTIFYAAGTFANGSCFNDIKGKYESSSRSDIFDPTFKMAIYEFNPSRKKKRNGLKPLTWRRLPDSKAFNFPRSVELPDGSFLVGNTTSMYQFNPLTGKTGKRQWTESDAGDGLSAYHPDGLILTLSSRYLRIRHLPTGKTIGIKAPQIHGKSIAIGKDNLLYSWDGQGKILTLDPRLQKPEWKLYDWGINGPRSGTRRVYSKWQYVSEYDVFVGLTSTKTGVWVYKHPPDLPHREFSNVNPQDLINNASPGSTVTLPPGTYGQGLFINKSLVVRLKGVNLWGVAKGKAIINVDCNHCQVIIEDFTAHGPSAGCIQGNCAGIKAEGVKFNLLLRRSHINNTVMGILTDNRGGTLKIVDSLIENTGLNDQSRTLGHGVYAGMIDALTLTNTIIRNVNGDGHILKSRAPLTVLEKTSLLGETGFQSRTIDLPCGGELIIEHSILQHGQNASNVDMIALGTEPRHCKPVRSSAVSITNSSLIFDRLGQENERARKDGPSYLFNWNAPLKSVNIKNNRIINLKGWSTNWGRKNIQIPDLSDDNQMCATRKDCGIE